MLADLYRRLVGVQSRHLAAAADVEQAWSVAGGRDAVLSQATRTALARDLGRLDALTTEPPLRARVRAATLLLTS